MPDSTTCPRQSIKVTRKGRGNTHTEKYHLEDGNRIADYQTALALETAQPRHLSEAIAAADCTQQSRAIIFFSPFLVILRFKDRPMSHPQQQNKRAGCLLPHTVCPKDPPVTLRTCPSFFQRELTYCYLQSGCLSYTPLVSRYVARVRYRIPGVADRYIILLALPTIHVLDDGRVWSCGSATHFSGCKVSMPEHPRNDFPIGIEHYIDYLNATQLNIFNISESRHPSDVSDRGSPSSSQGGARPAIDPVCAGAGFPDNLPTVSPGEGRYSPRDHNATSHQSARVLIPRVLDYTTSQPVC